MLPKIKHPTIALKVPSTGKEVVFRPFLVGEEKILLMAKQAEDPSEIFRACKQVINNCAIDKNFDIDRLAIFDLEWIFLQLRAVSVNNIVELQYKDGEDEEIYKFEVDLKQIEVLFPENQSKKIEVSDEVGLVMKYPAASLLTDKEYLESDQNAYYELVIRCIDKIYDGEEVHDPSNYTKEELEQFLDQCGLKTFEKISQFIDNMPKVYHKLTYTNKKGTARTIELQALTDFFTLG